MPDLGVCRACKAPLQWCVMDPSGKRNPLNVDEVDPVAVSGAVAFNPRTGKGRSITAENLTEALGWAEHGATFHLSHFVDCPQRGQFRQEKRQA